MANFNPFKFEGRIGRMQYFGFGVIWALGIILFSFIVGLSTDSSGEPGIGASLLSVPLLIVYLFATLSYGVRRLHDFDKSGWWYLLSFVPLANLVLGLILLFAPGSEGANNYGVRVR